MSEPSPGDIVDGKVWTGTEWVPARVVSSTPAPVAPVTDSGGLDRRWAWLFAGLCAISVIAAFAAKSRADTDSRVAELYNTMSGVGSTLPYMSEKANYTWVWVFAGAAALFALMTLLVALLGKSRR